MMEKQCIGKIKDYTIYISGQQVEVYRENELITLQAVRLGMDHFKEFLAKAKDLRIGWAQLPDDEVIYLYDKGDWNFGYAINLNDPDCSEWGYAPFR